MTANCLAYENRVGNIELLIMMTDPIADMLTRVRNAQGSRRPTVELPFSKLKFEMASILCREGFLETALKVEGTPPRLLLGLKYNGRTPAIQSLKRESKPGHRRYLKASELPMIMNDFGVAIVSTSRGLMTNREAKAARLGGEILCSVY